MFSEKVIAAMPVFEVNWIEKRILKSVRKLDMVYLCFRLDYFLDKKFFSRPIYKPAVWSLKRKINKAISGQTLACYITYTTNENLTMFHRDIRANLRNVWIDKLLEHNS